MLTQNAIQIINAFNNENNPYNVLDIKLINQYGVFSELTILPHFYKLLYNDNMFILFNDSSFKSYKWADVKTVLYIEYPIESVRSNNKMKYEKREDERGIIRNYRIHQYKLTFHTVTGVTEIYAPESELIKVISKEQQKGSILLKIKEIKERKF